MWVPLIDDAWSQRARYARGKGASKVNAAMAPDTSEVAMTLAFVRYALALAGEA